MYSDFLQALIHGLNRHYYSITINYRKNELEQKVGTSFITLIFALIKGVYRVSQRKGPAFEKMRLPKYQSNDIEISLVLFSICLIASRHSPRYRKIATTTTITTTTTFPFLLNLGLMDFGINFWDGDAHVYVCPLERGWSVASEARQVTLCSWKFLILRWSSWKLIGLKTEELLIHSVRFVDSWIEETFVWILVAFVQWLISL